MAGAPGCGRPTRDRAPLLASDVASRRRTGGNHAEPCASRLSLRGDRCDTAGPVSGLPVAPPWARAAGGRRPTRTIPVQRGQHCYPTSSNLQPRTRVRVTRRWGLLASMPDFAILYSLKCSGRPGAAATCDGAARSRSSGEGVGRRDFPDFRRVLPGAGVSSKTSGMRTSRGIWNSSQMACQVVTPSRALAICDRSSDVRCGRLPLSTSSEIVDSTASCQVDGGSVEPVPLSASTI